jgi:hypothetical protein
VFGKFPYDDDKDFQGRQEVEQAARELNCNDSILKVNYSPLAATSFAAVSFFTE